MKNDPRDKKKVKIAGILVVVLVQVFGEKKEPLRKRKRNNKKRNKKRPNYYKREIF